MEPIAILDQRYELGSIDSVQEHPRNARRGDEEFIDESMHANGFFGACVVDTRTSFILAGNHRFRRLKRSGAPRVPLLWVTPRDDAHARRIMLADNAASDRASNDARQLAELLQEAKATPGGLEGTGYTEAKLDALLAEIKGLPSGGDGAGARGDGGDGSTGPSLADRFGVAPFSVLDARTGTWQDRKRQWLALGCIAPKIGSELANGASNGVETHGAARGEGGLNQQMAPNVNRPGGKRGKAAPKRKASPGGQPMPFDRHVESANGESFSGQWSAERMGAPSSEATSSGTSIFDPVLCELMLRWFCPAGGRVLDCFAGGTSLGVVSARLGFRFTGVEVRPDQVEANLRTVRGRGLSAEWVCGDSATIDESFPGGAFDFVCTDPPYYNLERYSGQENDGTTLRTYEAFFAWYAGVLTRAASVLADDRFFVVKIGEARDARGNYCNVVGDTTRALLAAGLSFYNELILVTSVGSLPIRAGRAFERSRKVGKTHQNVLVFVKGDARRATAACGPVSGTVDLTTLDEDPALSALEALETG